MMKPDTTKPTTRKKHTRFICLIALLCCLMLLLTAYATITSKALDNGSFEQEKAHAQKLPPLTDDWKNILKEEDLSDFERTVLTRAVKNRQDQPCRLRARLLQIPAMHGIARLP